MIVHDFVGAIKKTACPKLMVNAFEFCLIHDQSTTKRSVNAGDRLATDRVFEHLVPGKNPFGVTPGVAVEFDSKDHIGVSQIGGLSGREHFGILQRRDSISPHTTPTDFIKSYGRVVCLYKVLTESRVNLTVKIRLELRIVGVLSLIHI